MRKEQKIKEIMPICITLKEGIMEKMFLIFCTIVFLAFSFVVISCEDKPNTTMDTFVDSFFPEGPLSEPSDPNVKPESEWVEITENQEQLLEALLKLHPYEAGYSFKNYEHDSITISNANFGGILLSGKLNFYIITDSFGAEGIAKGILKDKNGNNYFVSNCEFEIAPSVGVEPNPRVEYTKGSTSASINGKEISALEAYLFILNVAGHDNATLDRKLLKKELYENAPTNLVNSNTMESIKALVTGEETSFYKTSGNETDQKVDKNFIITFNDVAHTLTCNADVKRKIVTKVNSDGKEYSTTEIVDIKVNYISLDGNYFKNKESFKNWFCF